MVGAEVHDCLSNLGADAIDLFGLFCVLHLVGWWLNDFPRLPCLGILRSSIVSHKNQRMGSEARPKILNVDSPSIGENYRSMKTANLGESMPSDTADRDLFHGVFFFLRARSLTRRLST